MTMTTTTKFEENSRLSEVEAIGSAAEILVQF